MMMIMCAIIFSVCSISGFATGILVDLKKQPHPALVLTFFLSIIISLSAAIVFIVGHFTGA